MRLDWFVPALRKPKAGDPLRSRGQVVRVLQRILPKFLFSDSHTKRRGAVRRVLRSIGLTWLSSPARRFVQSVCFAIFVGLFFYVCWPYDARPAFKLHGGIPVEIDVETGRSSVEFDDSLPSRVEAGDLLYVVDVDRDAAEPNPGPFKVSTRTDKQITLTPTEQLTALQLEKLSLSLGPWSLHETHPDAWPSHYADNLIRKEKVAAEVFLVIDPLVSLSTALAARSWVWSLACAGIILTACILIPRGFCGYICPLGTLIDLFDWSIAKRVTRFQVSEDGWWVHMKYYLLLGTMIAAMFGVLLSGVFAAIPIITRGLLFLVTPLQSGLTRGWHLLPAFNAGQYLSIALFLTVLGLGFFRPRFWCKYVCPSGAVFSLGNLFRISERKVETSCINCNKCVEVCPFDAIKPDFTTRVTDCTLCQTCGGVCPTHAIKFVERWNLVELKVENDPPTYETSLGRRGFLATAAGVVAGVSGGIGGAVVTKALGANLADPQAIRPVRPPGSVPEQEFLQMCIRCGECFQACPNNVLQPLGFQQGLEGLWTPQVIADWAGCESGCNACGQVCPTGAIRALPMEEKKVARMGLAIVNEKTCLPFAEREACQLCVDECIAAGYNAIEFIQVGTQADESGNPIEETGYLAPVVRDDLCVGCGLCQTRCHSINVCEQGLLSASAIIIEAGEGREDRLLKGSYVELRREEQRQREAHEQIQLQQNGSKDSYLPDFLKDK